MVTLCMVYKSPKVVNHADIARVGPLPSDSHQKVGGWHFKMGGEVCLKNWDALKLKWFPTFQGTPSPQKKQQQFY